MRIMRVYTGRYPFVRIQWLSWIELFNADYPDPAQFSWSSYLEETGSKAVPAKAFNVVRALYTFNSFVFQNIYHFTAL